MVFPGTPDEERSLGRLARLSAECEQLGLLVMAESIPGGWPRTVPWTAENVGRGARIAVELGADIVKTMCPGPPEEFAAVAEACPAPVVALGGPKVDDEDQVVALARGRGGGRRRRSGLRPQCVGLGRPGRAGRAPARGRPRSGQRGIRPPHRRGGLMSGLRGLIGGAG